MCSWCWGFHPVLQKIEQQLDNKVSMQYVLGGLAPDSHAPMPDEMQLFLQKTWRTIENKIPGTHFNFDFWTQCQPRRSTYPACRAVIAAKKQDISSEKAIINKIQKAYYLNAKNPSDDDTLIEIANNLTLDSEIFIIDLNSEETQSVLFQEIKLSQQLGAQGFPSLILENKKGCTLLQIDYNNAENILEQIDELMAE